MAEYRYSKSEIALGWVVIIFVLVATFDQYVAWRIRTLRHSPPTPVGQVEAQLLATNQRRDIPRPWIKTEFPWPDSLFEMTPRAREILFGSIKKPLPDLPEDVFAPAK